MAQAIIRLPKRIIRGWSVPQMRVQARTGDIDAVLMGIPGQRRAPGLGFSLSNEFQPQKRVVLIGAGDGVVGRLMRSPIVPSTIVAILLPRLSPEYLFGLPAFLCYLNDAYIGAASRAKRSTLFVFGPQGLKDYLRSALRGSVASLSLNLDIREFHLNRNNQETAPRAPLLGCEQKNSANLYENAKGRFPVLENDDFSISAYMYGRGNFSYIISEKRVSPPNLDISKLTEHGVKPGNIMEQIKNQRIVEWPPGSGKMVDFSFALSEKKKARKIVFVDKRSSVLDNEVFLEDAESTDLLVKETPFLLRRDPDFDFMSMRKVEKIGALGRQLKAWSVAVVDSEITGCEEHLDLDKYIAAGQAAFQSNRLYSVEGMVRHRLPTTNFEKVLPEYIESKSEIIPDWCWDGEENSAVDLAAKAHSEREPPSVESDEKLVAVEDGLSDAENRERHDNSKKSTENP
ncbi:hypothetical protein NDN08_003630 [Rhodosorus marinus]|uniref:Uncharacterized protein n=1 Tax=Rhodosorus marinus TaxID=101924 RepID=A0AAV8V164_9RHOD|nr:hypothetical protein NDN08_003630 [Rhodosorus marinus]